MKIMTNCVHFICETKTLGVKSESLSWVDHNSGPRCKNSHNVYLCFRTIISTFYGSVWVAQGREAREVAGLYSRIIFLAAKLHNA